MVSSLILSGRAKKKKEEKKENYVEIFLTEIRMKLPVSSIATGFEGILFKIKLRRNTKIQ